MCSHFSSIKNFNQTLNVNGDFKQTVVETGDGKSWYQSFSLCIAVY